jgi:hypothetical protein
MPDRGCHSVFCDRTEFRGSGEPCVLHVEAAGLGVGEQAFDLPPLAVAVERGALAAIGDDDDQRAAAASGGEAQRACEALVHALEAAREPLQPAQIPAPRQRGQ